jgi:hypothetical protein
MFSRAALFDGCLILKRQAALFLSPPSPSFLFRIEGDWIGYRAEGAFTRSKSAFAVQVSPFCVPLWLGGELSVAVIRPAIRLHVGRFLWALPSRYADLFFR